MSEQDLPITWRISLQCAPSHAFALLTSDEGRMQFWAVRSEADTDGFHLVFVTGHREYVRVLEAREPTFLRLQYFGAYVGISIQPEDNGCIVSVTDNGAEGSDFLDRYAGWVSWLLIFKARADADLDLRNHRADRAWPQRFVDQ
jgi:hypothetical protein